ncbi:serine/threonine-protein kinase pim-3-like isoform X1 [Serinus canaria]|uniref:serine/threonine-protein kinase pim-3-like isoform X1 n=1 Tax=Serinus canaria TaxID=9135 RepID=UPI0021CCEF52|nr:serine/threonine-protein kinase pim-3-like isoform X1 [Serinus canaria]
MVLVSHCPLLNFLHFHRRVNVFLCTENVLVDLAMGEAKLIDFRCSTILQDTFYTQMSGTPEYSPPECILFGCYHGQPATIWSLGILLYELVCGHLPFHTKEDIVRGQLCFPAWVSQAGEEVDLLGSGGGGGTRASLLVSSAREDRWEAFGCISEPSWCGLSTVECGRAWTGALSR